MWYTFGEYFCEEGYIRMSKKLGIVLVEPEIPQNTGNISRTCACTDVELHLVKPLGFSIDSSHVKRAGLDYWSELDLHIHESLEDFLKYAQESGRPMFFASTKSAKVHSEMSYPEDSLILFGKETKGLPESLLEDNYDRCIRIPMKSTVRSLNLSNSVAIVLYEILRQHDYMELKREGEIPNHN